MQRVVGVIHVNSFDEKPELALILSKIISGPPESGTPGKDDSPLYLLQTRILFPTRFTVCSNSLPEAIAISVLLVLSVASAILASLTFLRLCLNVRVAGVLSIINSKSAICWVTTPPLPSSTSLVSVTLAVWSPDAPFMVRSAFTPSPKLYVIPSSS